MQQCGNCGHQNRPGIVFCENCGASLIGKLPLSTRALESPSEVKPGEVGIEAVLSSESITQGMATFMPGDSLKLDIEGAAEPMVLEPKAETILGRRDPATGATPDIDLTPFAGYRMGSAAGTRHPARRRQHAQHRDLGSSNGTFLNGQRQRAPPVPPAQETSCVWGRWCCASTSGGARRRPDTGRATTPARAANQSHRRPRNSPQLSAPIWRSRRRSQ